MHKAATMPVNTSSQTPLTGIWLPGRMMYVIGMNATVPTAAAASSAPVWTTFISNMHPCKQPAVLGRPSSTRQLFRIANDCAVATGMFTLALERINGATVMRRAPPPRRTIMVITQRWRSVQEPAPWQSLGNVTHQSCPYPRQSTLWFGASLRRNTCKYMIEVNPAPMAGNLLHLHTEGDIWAINRIT